MSGKPSSFEPACDSTPAPRAGANQASFAFLIAKREAAAAGLDIVRFRALLEADLEFTPHPALNTSEYNSFETH